MALGEVADADDVLRRLGFTADQSQALIKRIEDGQNARTRRVYTSLKTSSNKLRRVSIVLWGYSFAVWVYVIAMQLRYPESPYWPFAVWIPVRLDYLGELAFFLSFIFGLFAITWTAREVRNIRRIKDEIP
ncbi:MAG: hypothetical protein ABSE39_11805 [Candidatus Bathyarchaeia archaeon]|jgi:hypothetical protein